MKKYILVILIFIISIPVSYAQKTKIQHLPNRDRRTIHFGYYLSIVNNSYKVSYNAQEEWINPTPPQEINDFFVSVDASLGFRVGFIVDYRLNKNLSLRLEPGLMSNTKELTFVSAYFHNGISGPDGTPVYDGTQNSIREVSGTYMHIPVLLKFSSNRYNNIRPYVIGGVSYDYNFSSNQDNKEDNYSAEFRTKTSNFMYEVGVGMDFYLPYFKFTPSIRGVFAINNELVNDEIHGYDVNGKPYSSPWTGPIDYLGTRGIFLNLAFE